MNDDKVDKLHAHTVALEHNQEQLRLRLDQLDGALRNVRKLLVESVMREAELQTKVNVLTVVSREIIGSFPHDEEDLSGDDPDEGVRDHLMADGIWIFDDRCLRCLAEKRLAKAIAAQP